MKSARIWLRGERKQRRVGLLLQGTLRISLSYTYFMVEQSFRTCRLLEQVSATAEPSVRPQTIPYTCTLQSQDDSVGGMWALAATKDASCTLRSNCTHVFCVLTSQTTPSYTYFTVEQCRQLLPLLMTIPCLLVNDTRTLAATKDTPELGEGISILWCG